MIHDRLSDKRLLHMTRYSIYVLAALVACAGLQACAGHGHSVVTSTGTVIGVELSQHPATQMPQAKLGYHRGEFAYVPTNRDKGVQAGDTRNGASDTTDVLMELKYDSLFGRMFNSQGDGGIYQRLAVGSKAVSQKGAAVMFLRNANGDLTPQNAQALKTLQSVSKAPALNDMKLANALHTCSQENNISVNAVIQTRTAGKASNVDDLKKMIANNTADPEVLENIKKDLTGTCHFPD
jgi:hypothetical protein